MGFGPDSNAVNANDQEIVEIGVPLPAGTNSIGQVTANAGTNLNTSALALDSTVAKDSSLGTINTSINTLLKPADTLAAVTALGSITGALPAGTNNIGDVDVASSALPTGAATSANQATEIASLASIDSKLTAPIQVVGTGSPGVPTSTPLTIQYAEPQTYSAASDGFTVASTPTDVFTITGSASKTIRIHKIKVSGTTTSGSAIKLKISLVKRSTADSGGTSVSDTVVPHDSNNNSGTATVSHYTANPTLGTTVGVVRSEQLGITNQGLSGGTVEWIFNESPHQPLVLRGTSQQLGINFGSTSVTGSVISISVEWSEV